MRLLLDTHALLWWLLDDPQLSTRARQAVADPDNDILVSSVSAFEIATKHRLGKLWTGNLEPGALIDLLDEQTIRELPLTIEHAIAAGGLGGAHRDPFDRLLIAQSLTEDLPVVTMDAVFDEYGVDVYW